MLCSVSLISSGNKKKKGMIIDSLITMRVIILGRMSSYSTQLSGFIVVCFSEDAQCLFPLPVAEMGDHCSSRDPGYLSKCHFIPKQDEDFLCKVEDLHPKHK